MVAGISSALNTARDALLANLAAINVTGSNIANINTTGYTRLRAVFTPTSVKGSSSGDVGQISVEMTTIQRLYDRYLDSQIIYKQSSIGYTGTLESNLNTIETLLNESSGGGISETLSTFWDAWKNLSTDPDSLVNRQAVADAAQNLATSISQTALNLKSAQEDANANLKTTIDKLNEDIQKIAELNPQIASVEHDGGNASDLRDQRMQIMEDLSKQLGIQFTEDSTGQVNIFLPNGKPLVMGENSYLLDVEANATNNGYYDVVYQSDSTVINSTVTDGTIGALLELRDTTIAGYIDDLDSLTTRLVNTVNTQHAAGYDANGNVGGDFFQITGTTSPYIKIESPYANGENTYAGTATSGGTYTGDSAKNYLVDIVAGGALGVATYRISTDGGVTWGTTQTTAATITLGDGVTMSLTAGTFDAGDQFTVKVHSPAKDLVLNTSIYSDPSQIAASATVNGDGLNAKLINALGSDTTVMNGTATMGEYYNAFVSKVGQDVSNAGDNSTFQTSLLTQMNNQREQISGVSLDEEMLNLTKYQAGYAAAAKFSSILNDLMNTLIGIIQ
jgi:flagellar hook-associated protein 1 FlgK